MDIPEWAQHTLAAILGLIVLVILVWRLSPLVFFKFRSISVEGKITNWMSMREKGTSYFYPMIAFTTLDGKPINFRADERCEGRPMYPIGTKVVVHYDKKNPQNCRIGYPDSPKKN